jgi:hypothetical protein
MILVAVESRPAPDSNGLASPYAVENQAIGDEEREKLQREIAAEVGFLMEVLKTNDGDTEHREHRREIEILERAVIDLAMVEILIGYGQYAEAAERMDGVFRQLGKAESVFGTKRVPMFMPSGDNLQGSLQGLVLRHLDSVQQAYRQARVDTLQFRKPPRVVDKSLYKLALLLLAENKPQWLFNMQRCPMKSMSKYRSYVWAGRPVTYREDTWWYEGKDGVLIRCEFRNECVVAVEEEEREE